MNITIACMRIILLLGLIVCCAEQMIASSMDVASNVVVQSSLNSNVKITRKHKCKVFRNLKVCNLLRAASAQICGDIAASTVNGRPFPMHYAYMYSSLGQTIAAGSAISFEQNWLMTSAFTHSTTSNTDQIIINVSGVYRIDVRSLSSSKSYFAVSVNGVVPHPSSDPTIAGPTEYGANTGGAILPGQSILQLNAGDIVRVTNFSTLPITINNQDGAINPFTISASVLIQQLA